jgi:tryptophanase
MNYKAFLAEEKLKHQTRPFINHSVEFKTKTTTKTRCKALKEAGYNVFQYPAKLISGCDFLSDSGTTTMTNEQWAALHLGDESYGSNKGFFLLQKAINQTFGKGFFTSPAKGVNNAFLFHQGRSAEHALFSTIGTISKGMVIPSNGHFDTTEANIEHNNIKAINLFCKELLDKKNTNHHFKGNMHVKKLAELLKQKGKHIPLIYLTITNNTGGGQPVSMKNIKAVAALAKKYKKPLFFDACRFAENAWFIKEREKEYKRKSIPHIVKEMFSFVDGFTISFKKDGLVNMGGGVFIKDTSRKEHKLLNHLCKVLIDHQILTEGHPTYGGMSGRDIMALVVGLGQVVQKRYLDARIKQVQKFGNDMAKRGIPVLLPIGGHAVYIDVDKFFEDTKHTKKDFGGISFTALLLGLYGHRACELGDFAFGTYDPKTKKETFPEVSYVRFAVPRLRYEQEDLQAVVDAVEVLHTNRKNIPVAKTIFGKELPLRHFKARFEI